MGCNPLKLKHAKTISVGSMCQIFRANDLKTADHIADGADCIERAT